MIRICILRVPLICGESNESCTSLLCSLKDNVYLTTTSTLITNKFVFDNSMWVNDARASLIALHTAINWKRGLALCMKIERIFGTFCTEGYNRMTGVFFSLYLLLLESRSKKRKIICYEKNPWINATLDPSKQLCSSEQVIGTIVCCRPHQSSFLYHRGMPIQEQQYDPWTLSRLDQMV